MHVRLNDRKIIRAVKADAKARKCSNARAVEMALDKLYFPVMKPAKP